MEKASSMAASTSLLFKLTIISSLISLSSSISSDTIANAAEVLKDSGFVSMGLTLEVISRTLISEPSSLTFFAPPDPAFVQSGQPSLSLLQFHFSPLPLLLHNLKSLSSGTKIPTLLPGHSLFITTSHLDGQASLNNVKITTESPIYDDGILIIFGIEKFFDPNFRIPVTTSGAHTMPRCWSSPSKQPIGFPAPSWFQGASEILRSNGYSMVATFLDYQLMGYIEGSTMMTVFAPIDLAMVDITPNPSIFLRHVVPCKLLWNELVSFNGDSIVLQTFLDGFSITIGRSGNVLVLNGTPVFYPNMYYSDTLAVHGINSILVPQEKTSIPEQASDTTENINGQENFFDFNGDL